MQCFDFYVSLTRILPAWRRRLLHFALLAIAGVWSICAAQDQPQATIQSSIDGDGRGKIIVEAVGQLPTPPVFFRTTSTANVSVGQNRIKQRLDLALTVIQGDAAVLSLELRGPAQVQSVIGEGLKSWSVRTEKNLRFLDLHLEEGVKQLRPTITLQSLTYRLTEPVTTELSHIGPHKSVGFHSTINIEYAQGVRGEIKNIRGFDPIGTDAHRYHTSTGGFIKLKLQPQGHLAHAIELSETTLNGQINTSGDSVRFQWKSVVTVNQPDSEIAFLSGNAAVSEMPSDKDFRLLLAEENSQPVFKLHFPKTGTYPVTLQFVAAIESLATGSQRMDFTVAASAVVPVTLDGLDTDLEFHRDQPAIAPVFRENAWRGFLPATGRSRLTWNPVRKVDNGKLFFKTSAKIDAKVGTGLLRQDHQIDYNVLQGELTSLSFALNGPGEVLHVQGENILSWKVSQQDDKRQLDVMLNQPITGNWQINIQTQTTLGAFPVQVAGLRLDPLGTLLHSGYVRLANDGAVRLEPTGLTGLTQLSVDQFPADALQAQQVSVYRFPSADYSFAVSADRIQPEINVLELLLFGMTATDRTIKADVELDIREAPIREWDFSIPAAYSVVSVTGANVADYVAASEVKDDQRILKVLFRQDVVGRQLVQLYLEKSQPAEAVEWKLPTIEHPAAKAVRGHVGIVASPGYRLVVQQTDSLVEKPLSYFPKPTAELQHAFRIRELNWSATMQIEVLDRNIQADVFHLSSLSQDTVYGSALINYFVTGAPVSEWKITVPQTLSNVMVDGQDIRSWRQQDDTLTVALHQPVMGPYTLLVTFEEKPDRNNGTFSPGIVVPNDVQSEQGYLQVVSAVQAEMEVESATGDILQLDPLELPAELRLLSTAPPLGTWQYTERPFDLNLKVQWFKPGTTVAQVVEFSEATSKVSRDGEQVTDVLYYVKSRGQQPLKIQLPKSPVKLWAVAVNGQPVTARQTADSMLIPLPGNSDPNIPIQVSLRLGKPSSGKQTRLVLPQVLAPVLQTQWNIGGEKQYALVPRGGNVTPPVPVKRPTGFDWVAQHGLLSLLAISLLVGMAVGWKPQSHIFRLLGWLCLAAAVCIAAFTAQSAWEQRGTSQPLQLSIPILTAGETAELTVESTPVWQLDLSLPGAICGMVGIIAIIFLVSKRGGQQSETSPKNSSHKIWFAAGIISVAVGILLHGGSAAWFFGCIALVLFVMWLKPTCEYFGGTGPWIMAKIRQRRERTKQPDAGSTSVQAGPSGAASIICFMAATLLFVPSAANATAAGGRLVSKHEDQKTPSEFRFRSADVLEQQWQISHADRRLMGQGTLQVSGQPGDQFVLLQSPAVLTEFQSEELKLAKIVLPNIGPTYVVTIPFPVEEKDLDSQPAASPDDAADSSPSNPAADPIQPAINDTNSQQPSKDPVPETTTDETAADQKTDDSPPRAVYKNTWSRQARGNSDSSAKKRPSRPQVSVIRCSNSESGDQASVRFNSTSSPMVLAKWNQVRSKTDQSSQTYTATFRFQLDHLQPNNRIPVLTGLAALQRVTLSYDKEDWQVECPNAVQLEAVDSEPGVTAAKALLAPGKAEFILKPRVRDASQEDTEFFVESSDLFVPVPGVVNGRHLLQIRASQGLVDYLQMTVPQGLTVSDVDGPVHSWQFDAEDRQLKLQITSPQSDFKVLVTTQRSLSSLPVDLTLSPLKVRGANGEVGLLAVAFGPDAQAETLTPTGLSTVNLRDFDSSLNVDQQAVLQRVYRYGADGGELKLKITQVQPEVRVTSQQVLSLGDERLVLRVNFVAAITRAGLFQLSFPVPTGFEVESLTGESLDHWTEIQQGDQREVVLHLKRKTLGNHGFSVTLSAAAPNNDEDWTIPRLALNESNRQTGDLIVQPTTGIRLRTVSRKNVSEIDPRKVTGRQQNRRLQGAVAFRLLQQDWNLVLKIEKLAPWLTGQILHEITLREGQTKSTVLANIDVQNASIRRLKVQLPNISNNEMKTLRASGKAVSDFVRTAPDSDLWEIRLKRRVIGKVEFRIEYEQRGDRAGQAENLSPIGFPEIRQQDYFFAVRAAGRLELQHQQLTQGWQLADWNAVPAKLRLAENRNAPALTFKALAPSAVLPITATRHAVAEALKLRVSEGALTTVISSTGEQLTAVDVTVDVIQRSSLKVVLPTGGELISIFVNGESVNSIRLDGSANAWQFYILPGIDDRTAKVRFVYSVVGDGLRQFKLSSPELNVPLENIAWHVVAPRGFEIADHDGNLELVQEIRTAHYDRHSYLAKVNQRRQQQAKRATLLLQQANQLLQAGQQSKARWALNSVANQHALDAASNEDARIQLENLKTQQAVVGLNTVRQQLYLDNFRDQSTVLDNQQLRQAAAANPVLQQDRLNFRPQQLSQLLQGNTAEEIAVLQQIAGRLVRHQRTTEPAPQAIVLSLPEDGSVYTFRRSVQVVENSALELELNLDKSQRLKIWQITAVMGLLILLAGAMSRKLPSHTS